uniref:Uncharacterized protein n=1 Tax=Rhizophora mucronata TaxID=61149 RepID=A0A2P2QHT2_RHIMU
MLLRNKIILVEIVLLNVI